MKVDNIAIQKDPPRGDVIWGKPTDKGMMLYFLNRGKWTPLTCATRLDDLENQLDPDGDGNINIGEWAGGEVMSQDDVITMFNSIYD